MIRGRQHAALPPLIAVALAVIMLFGCSDNDAAPTDASPATTVPADAASTVAADPAAGEREGVPVFHPVDNPNELSAWGQLDVEGGELVLGDGVTPYTLNSALFSDYALKLRTVWLPDDVGPAAYDPVDVLDFPVGTVMTKTFYYRLADGDTVADARVRRTDPVDEPLAAPLDLATTRLVETRILAHRDDGWVALPYVWNDDQSEATLNRTGDLVNLTFVDADVETSFPYIVPNTNQCSGCHATNHTTKLIQPIGPKARHLNLDVDLGDGVMSQLAQWQGRGLLDESAQVSGAPMAAVWSDTSAPLDDRARAYLDVNCAHCHNTNGPADTSGLFLEQSTELGPTLGVCKPPIAAGTGTGGRRVGIHPGEPDQSIFVYRMETEDPGAMMPELGRALIHDEGVALIAEWIDSLDGSCS